MTPSYWEQATIELAQNDAVLRNLIHCFKQEKIVSRGCAFTTLARSIVGQQISVKAAESVWQKIMSNVPGFSPAAILTSQDELLRSCGLSRQKITYLRDLAQYFTHTPHPECAWATLTDQALVTELTQIKGIGRWTAEMFLIFHMQRPDVLPLDDIGLQRAISRYYNDNQPIDKKKMNEIALPWRPWRSVATWYLWRALDPLPVEY
ncbi:DNA-3-methyladenine glycosylase II [Nitrosomonas sp. PY1]|uniref:DNA-3-methyladenine glycosylase family protein n=1 Tax=Nitrosomonas sp. PY1 TaxID=1803906 RepID=UPI001FC88BB5|nr:DNA-3-methyladenine glycosylase 2 family protein [Nitrosomonas sp. PY1]GKS68122.1 DNA-3-methyladenine glycosylase II [Nitrosomonas sp. PY1]